MKVASLFEHVFGKIVERRPSQVSGELEVWSQYGKYVLHSSQANYSFDTLHKAFQNVFRKIGLREQRLKQVLILGFGAGSVAHILRYELRTNASITAVELDPEVIELSRKYFDLEGYDNLTMVSTDAFEFVKSCDTSFSLVVSDVFVDKVVPSKFLESEYAMELVRLTQKDGLGIMNLIVETKHMKKKLNELVSCFQEQNVSTKVFSVSTINRMIVWRKS